MKNKARTRQRRGNGSIRTRDTAGASSAHGAPEPQTNGPVKYVVWAALTAVTLAVFAPTIHHDFINIDDPGYVVENSHLHPFPSLDVIRWAFTTGHMLNWHPVTWLSHAVDFAIYGLNPGGHHATNLILHIINTILLFEVMNRMTRNRWRSALVATLFAVHPLHVESVAWVAERKDVLSAFFWMLTMLAYVNYARREGVLRYLMVTICLALGLMAKPMLVTLPLVLFLMDFWPLKRVSAIDEARKTIWHGVVRLFVEKIPWLVISTVSCAVTLFVQGKGGAVMPLEYFSLGARIKNAILAYATYLGKTIIPVHLAVFYPHEGNAIPMLKVLPAAVLLAAITAFAFFQYRRKPYLLTGWLWFLGTLVPVIGIVQVGTQANADRYTYLPLIGVFMAIIWWCADAAAAIRMPKWGLIGATCLVLLPLTVSARVQVGHWRDSETLLRHTLRVTDNNAFAHYNLGVHFLGQNRTQEAEKHFREALRIEPRYSNAHNNLGILLAKRGQFGEAISHFRSAIDHNPNSADAHQNLAIALLRLNRPLEAVPHLQRCIQLRPGNPLDYMELGNALMSAHRENDAITAYRQALLIDPSLWEARLNLGNVYLQTGRYGLAVEEYTYAIRLKPGDPLAYLNLSYALASQGEWEVAIKTLEEASRIAPENHAVRENLEKFKAYWSTRIAHANASVP